MGTNLKLYAHIRVHHDNERWTCAFCKKKFKTREGYKSHVEQVHSVQHKHMRSLKRWTCAFCKKQFKSKNGCNFHVERYHSKTSESRHESCKTEATTSIMSYS